MELETLFEDRDLIAVNKPEGMLVESSLGNEQSLLDVVRANVSEKAIAYHRLDRDTSGLVLFGKTSRLNKQIATMFSEKTIRKEYWALVSGEWPKSANKVESRIASLGGGTWENAKEGGKLAMTTFRRFAYNEGVSWIQALPKTGRTHQIRLHCLKAGYPILGDRLYGDGEGGLALHARSLRFRHPLRKETIEIIAKLPSIWEKRMAGWSAQEKKNAGLVC